MSAVQIHQLQLTTDIFFVLLLSQGPRLPDIALTRPRPRRAAMIGWDLMTTLNLRPIVEFFICVPLAHRDPALVHARRPTSPATPLAMRNRLTNSDREAMDDWTVVAPRNLVRISSGMEVQDDKRQMPDEMRRHGDGIDVRLDSIGGQLHACVANGKLYCEQWRSERQY